MINKIEERKKKKESIYKVKIFTGMMLLALVITGILMYSRVETTSEYPLEYHTIGEATRDIFNEHSDLRLTDIRYESEPITVTGTKDELQSVSDVVIEVDLFRIKEYLAMTEDVELDENGNPIEPEVDSESEDGVEGEVEENESNESNESESEDGTEDEELDNESEDEIKSNDEDDEGNPTEGIEGTESENESESEGNAEFLVDNVTETQGFIEMTDDGYMLVELPIKVIGYDKNYLPLETSEESIEVNIKVDEVVKSPGDEESESEESESEDLEDNTIETETDDESASE